MPAMSKVAAKRALVKKNVFFNNDGYNDALNTHLEKCKEACSLVFCRLS